MSVESRRKQREPKTEAEKALMAQKTKEGLQGLAIGPVTGLLGLPSDIIDLADMANDAIAKYGADTTIAQFSKLIKPQLDAVQEKYGREAFDKGFTELTGIKSDPTKPAQFLGELVSLGGLAKTGVKGAKVIGETISDTYKGAKKLFDDSTLPPPDNLALQTAGATKPVGQFDQTKKLLDKEKAITTEAPNIIPPDEFINAPKTTKMSMAGDKTPTGKQQIAKYKELDKTKKYNPDELFEMTGVYKGSDGKFRWEIDTTDAEIKNIDTFKIAEDEDAFTLSSLLKFDKLYQEYFEPIKVVRPSATFKGQSARFKYKPIKNLSVILKKKSTDKSDYATQGEYYPASDMIILYTDNIYTKALMDQNRFSFSTGKKLNVDDLYKYRLESTLLHEVQHAIQAREGFTRGSNTENFLRDGYGQDLKTNDALLDNSYFNFFNNFEAEGVLTTRRQKDDLDYASKYIKKTLEQGKNFLEGSSGGINFINGLSEDVAKNYLKDINLPLDTKFKIVKQYAEKIKDYNKNKSLLDAEYNAAYKKYRDSYGEKEARLVQKRFERRLDLKAQLEQAIKEGKKPSGDFLSIKKQMSAYEGIPENMRGQTRAERDRLDKLARTDPKTGKVKPKKSIKNLAKGGDMKKQMDLFQEGGLKDEGGTVDPVSGNDVPPGSTQEEVRDDIPAQLSEGEFVFPADVVRFLGLNFLMELRQKAKAGLKRMEEMGQMGNSDEATLPDDIPFTIEDLDMEDEQEYNEGGVVQAQTGTFVAPGAGVTTMPSQFAGQQLPSAGATPSYTVPTIPPPVPAPVGGFRPLTTSAQTGQQATGTTPTFQTLIGRKPGQYDEFREYVNEAGMKLQIPFKDGQPIYPIPEGYTFVDPEEVKVEDPKVTDVKPQTTKVVEQGGDDPDPTTTSAVDLAGDPLSYKSMFDMDKLDTTLKDIAFSQLNLFNVKDAVLNSFNDNIDVNKGVLAAQTELLTTLKQGELNAQGSRTGGLDKKYGKNFNLVDMSPKDRDSVGNMLDRLSKTARSVLTDNEGKGLSVDELLNVANRFGMDVKKDQLFSKGTNIISTKAINKLSTDIAIKDLKDKLRKEEALKVAEKTGIARSTQTDADRGYDFGADITDAQIEDRSVPVEDQSDDYQQAQESYESTFSDDAFDDPLMNTGGLLKKKKPKVKKMKRGGLASRK